MGATQGQGSKVGQPTVGTRRGAVTLPGASGTWEYRMRWSLILFACCALTLPGCFYYAGYSTSYSVVVITSASPDTTFQGLTVSLNSAYAIDNASVYITSQDWSVTDAPLAATYVLSDQGRSATLLPNTPGTYVMRYRTWYYTNWDYSYCYCTYYTSYRESYVTVTVLPAPST